MKISMLMLFASLSLSAFAQKEKHKEKHKEEHKEKKAYSALAVTGVGVSFQQFDGLNSRIAPLSQYKELRDYMATLSLGSMKVHKQFISGMNITGGSSMSGDRDKRSSALRFLSGDLFFGYDVLPSEKFMLYPMAGVGIEGYQARFYKDNSGVNFNDVLIFGNVQNNIRPVVFKNLYTTYNVGLGFAFKPSKDVGFVGVQARYTGSFKDKAWKSSDNQTLGNAPVDELSRFQVTLVFGNQHKMMGKH